MRKISRLTLGLTIAALMVVPVSQALAGSHNIQGMMLEVGAAPSTDPFAGRCAQTRIWSTINMSVISPTGSPQCPTTGVGSCALGRDAALSACNRGWSSNILTAGPGYNGHIGNMTEFDATATSYFTYMLWENVKSPNTANAATYYYCASQTATSGEKGRIQDPACVGTVTTSCFLNGRNSRHGANAGSTRLSTIANEGGFAPVPVPRIGTISGSSVPLTWDAATCFDNGDGAPSPIVGYRLARIIDNDGSGVCNPQADNAVGWTLDLNNDGTQDPLVVGTSKIDTLPPFTGTEDCVQYSLRVVFNGPDLATSGPSGTVAGEISTAGRGFASQGVKVNPSAVTIFNFGAKYVGKNTFNVGWSSGSESGIARYRLLRSTSPDTGFLAVGSDITARGDNQTYSVLDKVSRSMGTTFYYNLLAINTDGSETIVGNTSGRLPAKTRK